MLSDQKPKFVGAACRGAALTVLGLGSVPAGSRAQGAELKKYKSGFTDFSATFANWCLWVGLDLRTVQQWLGHTDMESIDARIEPSRNQRIREKVSEIFA
jgi:integrase